MGGRGGFLWFLCLAYFSWEAKNKDQAPGGRGQCLDLLNVLSVFHDSWPPPSTTVLSSSADVLLRRQCSFRRDVLLSG